MSGPVRVRHAGLAALAALLGLALAGAPPTTARAQASQGQGAGEVLDGIAAQVGSEIVLISDVNQVAAPAVRGLRAEGAGDRQIAMLKVEILERMIERALIRQVVRRAELEASEFEVDEAIDAIAAENDLTLEQLKESVEAQGLPYEAYRQRIKEEIEHTKVMNGMVGSQVRIDEKEIRELYEAEYSDQPEGGAELRLRHVLVSADPEKPGAVDEACEQVRAAARRVRAGEPFTEVAADVSEMNPKQGGELGWVHRRFLADWMVPIVDGMQPGDVSDVVTMPFGCNLIQLVDRRPYERITYEEVRAQLRRRLFSERMAERYAEFIEELREQTYIERKGIYAEASRLRAERAAEPSEPPGTF